MEYTLFGNFLLTPMLLLALSVVLPKAILKGVFGALNFIFKHKYGFSDRLAWAVWVLFLLPGMLGLENNFESPAWMYILFGTGLVIITSSFVYLIKIYKFVR